ncbi:MAG: hypothetical protein WBE22_01025, partial [Halobacteriota archaeon]
LRAYHASVTPGVFRSRITPNGWDRRKGNPRCNFLSTDHKITQILTRYINGKKQKENDEIVIMSKVDVRNDKTNNSLP